ncbi:hypothetical protein J6I75_12355 [Pseudidiomarina sp. 1APP75-27a]|uniref:hypothetical protein n=1 Tax=Pseudidiomarina terrestris TaxID=2820060 RepID=UPI002B05E084|nr:hypothetical protein [Pseudidiomarina sp. 1APP75-27a]MEA3589143.1 hypothetical protein [Pseudidiomarina sp. 1APP75-27a]
MRSRGFTSIWLLPILAALLVLTLAVMRGSQNIRSVWYQQNVADNMASSAATLLARELNLLALINRALLANELTLAQLAGLYSWFQMMRDVVDRNAAVSTWIPYLNSVTRQIAVAVGHAERPLTAIIRSTLYFQHLITTALRATQWFARLTFSLEIPRTLAEVLAHHDVEQPSWQVLHAPGLIQLPWLWWSYVPAQHSGNDSGLAHRLMLASMDGFTRERSYKWFSALQVSVKKAGAARLQSDTRGHWSWQSMDTVAIHITGLLDSEEIPWGDGLSYLGHKVSQYGPNDFGNSPTINPRTSAWAQAMQHSLTDTARRFNYFNRRDLEPDDWPQVIVVLNDVTAKAGVFFSRPQSLFPRIDAASEQANLFNSLWQPQLLSLTLAEKGLLASLYSGGQENEN